ncbi:helix-turn-helix domain-containing protein [Streptomyces aquilus]|uniref:helix-turn-helix domain-containing protein n=1 Tax=Streptomyces aquilus TaxID=2548456 RepID=UPI00369606CE
MPDPAVPPTPPVPLAALLAREDLALRQIAGPVDPATVIHWAHTSEMADPYPYLLGGELLLTAGVHVPEAAGSGAYFDDYVSRIVAAGGAALGFGLAPVHDTVPRALVAACEAYELPLIEVPPQTTFSGVARAVWQLMAQARLAELRRVTEAQQSLAAAASRPDPVPSVLRQLAQRISGQAVLYGPEGTEIAAAGRGVRDAARDALAELAQVVRPSGPGTPSSATHTAAGLHLAAYALGAGQGFVLGVAAPAREPGDHTIASVAAVLLSLLTGEHQSGSGAARSSALVRLLLGGRPEEVAGLLGADRWVVVHAAPATRPGTTTAAAPPTRQAAADATPAARAGAPAAAPAPQDQTPTNAVPPPQAQTPTDAAPAPRTRTAADASPAARPGATTDAARPGVTTDAAPAGAAAAAPTPRTRTAADVSPTPRAQAPAIPATAPRTRDAPTHAPDAVAASALGAALGSSLVDLAADVVRILLPAEREPAAPHPGWILGVSAPVEPRDWPLADTQAARALARARATRGALVRHGGRPGLAALVPVDEAEAHARALLAPLAGSPALLDTLRTWLSLHGSWDRTAVALAVHRNTVRQRVAKCAALLDADLDDPDVRMELWFALRE